MNWNDKNSTDVAKERIWKEVCVSESRELKVFDHYREPKFLRPTCSPVSVRSPDFLDRQSVHIRSVAGTILPAVRERSIQRLISGREVSPSSPQSDESSSSPSFSEQQKLQSPSPSRSPLLLRQRPTSSQEIGSCLVPLIPGNNRHFHYGIRKLQLSPAYVVK
jgi:hypothetical protein